MEFARVSLLFCVLTYASACVSPRATQMPSELLWQVSSFEFSGKSIGKTVFEREKKAYFRKLKKFHCFELKI